MLVKRDLDRGFMNYLPDYFIPDLFYVARIATHILIFQQYDVPCRLSPLFR